MQTALPCKGATDKYIADLQCGQCAWQLFLDWPANQLTYVAAGCVELAEG